MTGNASVPQLHPIRKERGWKACHENLPIQHLKLDAIPWKRTNGNSLENSTIIDPVKDANQIQQVTIV
ncbi:hypothetical protein C0995_015625 [Termitomyces sp. Mi166|nr:hypothetical protein C0995_015625 [Termitomyces sp. Mi166\